MDGYFQVVTTAGGERYLHLSTFGSDTRVREPKSSQSLQLNEQMAQELVDALREVFPGLK
ncbi:hypothetical protein ACPCG0_03740 [Propionibacteriaceae bacterium Y1923]|uniref:hypothetical protein n=1 Tax=Aestuariimicrobium sp. Y1814 TaxID=3418742 RepID=UPI003C1E2616